MRAGTVEAKKTPRKGRSKERKLIIKDVPEFFSPEQI